jgi:hypothetical protein
VTAIAIIALVVGVLSFLALGVIAGSLSEISRSLRAIAEALGDRRPDGR